MIWSDRAGPIEVQAKVREDLVRQRMLPGPNAVPAAMADALAIQDDFSTYVELGMLQVLGEGEPSPDRVWASRICDVVSALELIEGSNERANRQALKALEY